MLLRKLLRSTAYGIVFAAGIGFTSPPVQAGGVPVIDVASLAEALKDAITQLEALKAAYDQLSELAAQADQLARDAQGLANLSDLADLLGEFEGLAGVEISEDILGSLASIDPTAIEFLQQAEAILGADYSVPQSIADVDALLADLKNTGADVDAMLENSRRMRRDTEATIQDYQAVVQSSQASEKSREAIDAYRSTLSGLGNDDTAASIQLLASIQLHVAQQNEELLEQLRISNLHNARLQLSEGESRRLELERKAEHQRKRQARATPFQPILIDIGNL